MRPAPSPTEAAKYPITSGLALLAVVVTLLAMKQGRTPATDHAFETGRDVYDVLAVDVRAFFAEPWRLASSALPHVGVMHLLFNVIWLWILGAPLEERYGMARYFLLLVALQLPSAAAEYAFFYGGVGLSGVGYGLWGFRWALQRRDPRYLDDMDDRTTATFAIWFVVCVVATYANLMPVANVAHGVGAVTGILLGYATARAPRWRIPQRAAAGVGAAAVLASSLVAATIFRPQLNRSGAGAADAAYAAFRALTAQPPRPAEAARYLERCLQYEGDTGYCSSLLPYARGQGEQPIMPTPFATPRAKPDGGAN